MSVKTSENTKDVAATSTLAVFEALGPKIDQDVDETSLSVVPRDEKGRFPAGVSGNPHGRAKGTKNRITIARLMLEEGLRQALTVAGPKIMNKAIKMALEGDPKIMRVLLDKMLASPRGDDAGDAKDAEVRVIVQNLTSGAPSATKIEAHKVTLRLPQENSP